MSTSDILSNLQERVEYLENHFPKKVDTLREKIGTYDKLIQDNVNLNNKFDSFIKSVENHAKELSDTKNGLLSMVDTFASHSSVISRIDVKASKARDELQDFQKKNDLDLKNLEGRLVSNQNYVNEDLKKQIQSKAQQSDIDFAYNILKVLINDLVKKFEEHLKSFESFKYKVNAEMLGIVEVSVSRSQHVKDQKANQEGLQELKSLYTTVQQNQIDAICDLKSKISETHQSMWVAIAQKPDPNLILKTDLDKKLEGIALDAKNSVIRTQNSDQKVLILEKKIENINLLLKKYELNQ